jgi:hypothetical protein
MGSDRLGTLSRKCYYCKEFDNLQSQAFIYVQLATSDAGYTNSQIYGANGGEGQP